MLASILALGGMSVSTIGTPLLTVQAAEEATVAAKEYHTQGGIANMGSSTANITIKGNEGQTLVGKKFHVYKLFLAQNAQGMESINYTFNPTYEQALKNVAAKALSVPVDDVTEYMVIDYIQSLNSYKVEGAQTEQELEGRYSKFRYFVEDLRNEIEKQGVQSDLIISNVVPSIRICEIGILIIFLNLFDHTWIIRFHLHLCTWICRTDHTKGTC